jgi:hypothetical protein
MYAGQRLRMSLVGFFGVIMVVVAFAAPATAAPYTHHRPTTSVSNSHPAVGSTITFCGAGFRPGETVNITLRHTGYPSVTASSSGVWCTSVALSAGLRGNVRLTASSTTSHRSSSTRIQIGQRHGGNGGGHGDNGGGNGGGHGDNSDDNGGGHGDNSDDNGGGNGGGHGDNARALGLGWMGGSSWIDRVLGLTVTGGSSWIDRVLARA